MESFRDDYLFSRWKPLSEEYILHSYWKSFRKTNYENYSLLLPLKMNFPFKSIKAQGKEYPINFYVYLFPFGCCCTNMEVKIDEPEMTFDELRRLIGDIKRALLGTTQKSFGPYSHYIVQDINKELFSCKCEIADVPIHTLVFLKTSSPLLLSSKDHKDAIASIMQDKDAETYISALNQESVDDMLGCKLNTINPGEILLFRTNSTFIFPSHTMIGNAAEGKGQKKIMRRLKCMYNNYCSFLNLLFAVNRYLKLSTQYKKDVSDQTLKSYECFLRAFPKTQHGEFDITKIYFGKVFIEIEKQIGFGEKMNIIYKELHSQ